MGFLQCLCSVVCAVFFQKGSPRYMLRAIKLFPVFRLFRAGYV